VIASRGRTDLPLAAYARARTVEGGDMLPPAPVQHRAHRMSRWRSCWRSRRTGWARGRGPRPGASAILATYIASLGMLFVLPQYVQYVQERSALASGLELAPFGLGLGALAPV
jgi:hypothetical protein